MIWHTCCINSDYINIVTQNTELPLSNITYKIRAGQPIEIQTTTKTFTIFVMFDVQICSDNCLCCIIYSKGLIRF